MWLPRILTKSVICSFPEQNKGNSHQHLPLQQDREPVMLLLLILVN